MALPPKVRKAHRIVAALWLLFVALALSIEAAGGPESPLITIPIVVFLVLMVITGGYMLVRPWVQRFRAR